MPRLKTKQPVLIKPIEAMKAIGFKVNETPNAFGKKPRLKTEHLAKLWEREGLQRFQPTGKGFMYDLNDCMELAARVVNEGLRLT